MFERTVIHFDLCLELDRLQHFIMILTEDDVFKMTLNEF